MNCPDCNVPMDSQADYDVQPLRRPRLIDMAWQCPACTEIFHQQGQQLMREELPVDVAFARR